MPPAKDARDLANVLMKQKGRLYAALTRELTSRATAASTSAAA
jgi:hypothetical protein